MKFSFIRIICFSLLISCQTNGSKESTSTNQMVIDTLKSEEVLEESNRTLFTALSDTSFLFLEDFNDGFVYDMKYATPDNFLKTKVYSCNKCLIRKEVAAGLTMANKLLIEQGYRIKLFDCYRPLSIQKKMWDVLPDSKYVANPKFGSVHNRGGAVDITLVDIDGKELAMGTSFDHFGEEAHHSYSKLSDIVIANRKLLKETMEAAGFTAIETEWWHYNFVPSNSKYPISDFETKCN